MAYLIAARVAGANPATPVSAIFSGRKGASLSLCKRDGRAYTPSMKKALDDEPA